MHAEAVTTAFARSLQFPSPPSTFPAGTQPVYSPQHVLAWLRSCAAPSQGLCVLAFSAGVVGALGAVRVLYREGIPIRAFIALDGWGVPLQEPFPTHRLSHDQFTHYSSRLLDSPASSGEAHFYAEPAVEHLALWRSPHQVSGWQVCQDAAEQGPNKRKTTAASFIEELLQRYTGPVREPVQPKLLSSDEPIR